MERAVPTYSGGAAPASHRLPFDRNVSSRRNEIKPSPRREPVIHKFVPRDDDLEDRVDEILKKISEHGRESLTEGEKEILMRASEVYKKRRS